MTDQPTEVFLYEQVLILVSCLLSFLGSCVIICTYVLWPDLRTKPRLLLVFLSVTDLLSALSYFYGVLQNFQTDSLDCVIQGAVSTFANTSSFFWTVSVALYLYIIIVRADQRLADSFLLWFHILSWGLPLGITVAAVSLQKIGYDASRVSVGWCWVRIQAKDHILWMLLTGNLWEIMAYLILPLLYLLIKKHIGRAHSNQRMLHNRQPTNNFEHYGTALAASLHFDNHAALSEYRPILASSPVAQSRSAMADRKLTLIPVIFIFLRIWSTIRFFLMLTKSPAVENPVLMILHGIGNTFQGGANCIMFVLFTQVVRSRLASALCCCRYENGCSCCTGTDEGVPQNRTLCTEEMNSSLWPNGD
ncbi:GP157 protein, partial [Polypterus senegalus]|nr:GP157 protein [Polypterus senegalus]